MIIKIILIAALGAVFLYSLSQKKRAFWPAVILGLISFAGSALVLAPDLANTIANAVGVGRGADLVLYCFVVLALGAAMNIHLRLRAEHEKITEVARSVAILGASKPEVSDYCARSH